ncbi:MAG: transposase [bacterium]
MRRRQWSSQEKFKIIMETLSGQKDIGLLCKEYKISHAQYYRWRDQLLNSGHLAFEKNLMTQGEKSLLEENKRLKKMLSKMKIELKRIESKQES